MHCAADTPFNMWPSSGLFNSMRGGNVEDLDHRDCATGHVHARVGDVRNTSSSTAAQHSSAAAKLVLELADDVTPSTQRIVSRCPN